MLLVSGIPRAILLNLPSEAGSNHNILSPSSFVLYRRNMSLLTESNLRQSTLESLPASSFDGSHLTWQAFRWNVLAPHRIRIVDALPKDRFPKDLLKHILGDTARFDQQKADFREQVTQGRGFGSSPVFPPNILPAINHEPRLSRCMIPKFSRDALPQRAPNQQGPVYELQIPRSDLGCGFSADAFDLEDFAFTPPWLAPTGTIVHFDTGYVSPGASVYAPFLVFERARGTKDDRLQAANNRCAIAGSWSIRALQMLYNNAYTGEVIPDMPKSFSCTIDNDFAVVNYHWIDHGEDYYMSPLGRFDLTRDEQFSRFLLLIEAIGDWGVNCLLPRIKAALSKRRIAPYSGPATPTPSLSLSISTALSSNTEGEDPVLKALKTSFGSVPWRINENDVTPISAADRWGSPTAGEMLFSSLDWSTASVAPARKSVLLGNPGGFDVMRFNRKAIGFGKGAPEALQPPSNQQIGGKGGWLESLQSPRSTMTFGRRGLDPYQPLEATALLKEIPTPALSEISGKTALQPTSTAKNSNLVTQKRLDHSMNEIQDLQCQVQALQKRIDGSTTSLHCEISGMRDTLTSVLLKEKIRSRSRATTPEPSRTLPPSTVELEPSNPLVQMRQPGDVNEEIKPVTAIRVSAPEIGGSASIKSIAKLSNQYLGSLLSNNFLGGFLLGCFTDLFLRVVAKSLYSDPMVPAISYQPNT